ncbi:MAG TPA: DUF6624 domain-containing protein [Rhabdochlamydiaceae bacterium]|jgi:hypothetical protein|nr:DUF6624 domain-containing protein [Rhabdochlamydiaceae bacterium]
MRLKIAIGLTLTCLGFAQEPAKTPNILSRVLPGLSNTASSPVNMELAAEINAMVEEDQSAREKISDEEKTTLSEIIAKHNLRLKEIISTYGWPGIHLAGLEGSTGFWVLVLQQNQDIELQKQCVTLLKEAVNKQDAQYREYSFLLDRVRKNENLPQVYGTQFEFIDGKCYLHPIEDLENVNQRRLEAGLGTLEFYRNFLKKIYHLDDADFIIRDRI